MKRIAIIGANGVIGQVVTDGLEQHATVRRLDLPGLDARIFDDVKAAIEGVDIVIHLALGKGGDGRENWRSGYLDPDNVTMELNVLQAAVELGIPRVIMASSVHADGFNEYDGQELLQAPGTLKPLSPYGTHKLILETIGKFYSERFGIEFVGLRFGGVTPDNTVKTILKEPQVWLSHRDLVSLMRACVDAESVPNNYSVVYAVSENDGRLHDHSNPFGWQPQDNSKDAARRDG